MSGYRVAVVGATGLVGQEFIRILEQRNFPMDSVTLLASDRSAGRKLFVGNEEVLVKETANESFAEIDIALFSAGAEVSRHFSPMAVSCRIASSSEISARQGLTMFRSPWRAMIEASTTRW